jgi:succinate-semialdehyde dehydrogenase/glutarate-semialdehyde dehydrogenase
MITRKVGPALAAGCSVVIKPSEETPLSALALVAIAEEAGVPLGVINCLTVGRDEVVSVGTAMCHSPLLRKISFTGSTKVGKWLMREAASTVKKVSMELGGNAPFIVFDDADLEVAARALMAAKFRNAGQVCIASNRVLVQSGVYEEFAAMLTRRVNNLKVGSGLQADSTLGPLINAQALEKVSRHVEDCVSKGASLTTGGSVCTDLNEGGGTFYAPTVLTGVSKHMLPFCEETFGPVCPLMSFETEEEALQIANDTPYGLAAYACTKDLARAFRVAEGLDVGMVGINEGAIGSELSPFGGVKESGVGREGGHWGVDEYLEVKSICLGLGQ